MRGVALAFCLVFAHAQPPDSGARDRSLWNTIKRSLLAPGGDDFFEQNLKNALVPGGSDGVRGFRATVISVRQSSIVLSVSDGKTPDVTIQLNSGAHPSGLAAGDTVLFEGVGERFQREPFMLTLEIYGQAGFIEKAKGTASVAHPATTTPAPQAPS